MGKLVRKLFGGTDKETMRRIQRQAEGAEDKALQFFPAAEQSRARGFQDVLDLQAQTIPQQFRTFQEGNVGAQQTRLRGLHDFQAALLGNALQGNVQPQRIAADTGFAQQKVPDFISMEEALMTPDIGTSSMLAGVEGDVDLFRLAGQGEIGDFNKKSRNFFRDLSNQMVAGSPNQTRFIDDPILQARQLVSKDDPRFDDVDKEDLPEGLLTEKNVDRIRNLLNQFSSLTRR